MTGGPLLETGGQQTSDPAEDSALLHTPAPLSEDALETAAMLAGEEYYTPMLRTTLVSTPEGRAGLALAAEIGGAGTFHHRLALRILGHAMAHRGANRDGAILALNSLRIAEVIAPRFLPRPDRWTVEFSRAAIGALSGRQSALSTEAELRSVAAVAAFMVSDERGEYSETKWKRNSSSTRIANRALDKLLRDRPDDLDRIMEYVTDRGVAPEDLAAADELRAWLDSGTPAAVGDGWL